MTAHMRSRSRYSAGSIAGVLICRQPWCIFTLDDPSLEQLIIHRIDITYETTLIVILQ